MCIDGQSQKRPGKASRSCSASPVRPSFKGLPERGCKPCLGLLTSRHEPHGSPLDLSQIRLNQDPAIDTSCIDGAMHFALRALALMIPVSTPTWGTIGLILNVVTKQCKAVTGQDQSTRSEVAKIQFGFQSTLDPTAEQILNIMPTRLAVQHADTGNCMTRHTSNMRMVRTSKGIHCTASTSDS